jgi:hypothetical protein
MLIEKVACGYVNTLEGVSITVTKQDGNVVFAISDGETLTFTPEELRKIVATFARQPRGPNKDKGVPAAAGNGTHASASA